MEKSNAAQPQLKTERLLLRPFSASDADEVQRLAGDMRIADVTASIPHPYPHGLAEKWIRSHPQEWHRGTAAVFAVTRTDSGVLLGCVSLTNITTVDAEIGYWIGVDYWNNGYCSEAVRAVIRFGFEYTGINRIYARHLSRNPASGKVMQKAGMIHTGTATAECGYRRFEEDIATFEITMDSRS